MNMPYAPAWGLKLVRRVRRLSRADLAAATRVPVELLADYEEERQPLPGDALLAVIATLRLTAEEREALSRSMPHHEPRGWQAPYPGDPSPELQRLIEETSWEAGERVRKFAIWRMLKGGDPEQIEADIEQEQSRAVAFGHDLFLVKQMTLQDELRKRSRQPSPEDRKEAAELWRRMKRHDARLRRIIIDVSSEFRNWALCERLGLESLRLARRTPREGMELAELALVLARRIRGDQIWRRRLRGFALACLGNAHLAQGDRVRAEEALAQARRLWEAGTASGTEILDEAPLRTLAASLQ
jgi:transcriptional regulator with XRE-family HTH domain